MVFLSCFSSTLFSSFLSNLVSIEEGVGLVGVSLLPLRLLATTELIAFDDFVRDDDNGSVPLGDLEGIASDSTGVVLLSFDLIYVKPTNPMRP
jgi:hypothetical protein